MGPDSFFIGANMSKGCSLVILKYPNSLPYAKAGRFPRGLALQEYWRTCSTEGKQMNSEPLYVHHRGQYDQAVCNPNVEEKRVQL